jgi:hypothetical protein
LPLKRHHIPDIDDLAMEKIRLLIEDNMGEIPCTIREESR